MVSSVPGSVSRLVGQSVSHMNYFCNSVFCQYHDYILLTFLMFSAHSAQFGSEYYIYIFTMPLYIDQI